MSRRSLRPQLNQIRRWVRQGRTDAWIAHQLEVTVQQIQAFKREHDLEPDGDGAARAPADDEVDLRAEDDDAIAAQLEAEAAPRRGGGARRRGGRRARTRPRRGRGGTPTPSARAPTPARRAAARAAPPGAAQAHRRPLEGTFDHGEEGYGLWLDPAVEDDPVYAEHWAGHGRVEVTIEEDQIVIRRAGGDEDDDD